MQCNRISLLINISFNCYQWQKNNFFELLVEFDLSLDYLVQVNYFEMFDTINNSNNTKSTILILF